MTISPLVSAMQAATPALVPQPLASAPPAIGVAAAGGPQQQGRADSATSEQARQDTQSGSGGQSADEAIEEINASLRAWATNLRFEIDPDAQRLVVSVVDSESGDVLRTVPSEAAIRIAKMVASLQGKIVSTQA